MFSQFSLPYPLEDTAEPSVDPRIWSFPFPSHPIVSFYPTTFLFPQLAFRSSLHPLSGILCREYGTVYRLHVDRGVANWKFKKMLKIVKISQKIRIFAQNRSFWAENIKFSGYFQLENRKNYISAIFGPISMIFSFKWSKFHEIHNFLTKLSQKSVKSV